PPWEGRDSQDPVGRLLRTQINLIPTISRNLTKSKLRGNAAEDWELLLREVDRVASQSPKEPIYIVIAKEHEDELRGRLGRRFPPEAYRRLIIHHYGETKGSNDMRDCAAIIFATVQFKQESYYRALALATGKGEVSAPAKTFGHKQRGFTDP